MNNIKNIILRFLTAMSFFVVAVSCTQEQFGNQENDDFASGLYPLQLTASVEGMETRADGTGFWAESDTIRVRISTKKGSDYYPWVGKYVLNADGYVQDAIDALAWPYENGYVSAWYPFFPETEGSIIDTITDQSEGYHKFDYLSAVTEREMNYKETVGLNFKHQMAKVRCQLIKGDGVTEEDLKTAKIKYYGIPTVKFSEEGIQGVGSPDYITPASDFSALMVPQDVSGLPFITVDLTLTINDAQIPKTLVYTPQETLNLEAGNAYTFNIKVQKDRLEVQTISGAWKESLENTESTSDKYQIYLPEDTEELGELEFSKNVITEGITDTRAGSGRLVEVIGDSFTISYKPTTKNCGLGLVFVNKNTTNQVKRIYYEKKQNSVNVGYYEFTYTIASPIGEPVSLEIGEHIEIGDILFQDGSWSCSVLADKTPVGMVFRIGAGGNSKSQILDVPDTYKKCEGWNGHEIRGYAVAMKDAFNSKVQWSTNGSTRIIPSTDSIDKYYSGLYIADRLKEIIPNKKLKISNFPAFQKAEEYKDLTDAPKGSSGWYLPSYHQLADIRKLFVHPQRREWILNVGGKIFESGGYWSATESWPTLTYAVSFDYGSSTSLGAENKTRNYYVRAVLTF